VSWTPALIPDLTGCRAVVTGANSGIGYVTALELVRHGCHVVLACRDARRAAAALRRLQGRAPGSADRAGTRGLDPAGTRALDPAGTRALDLAGTRALDLAEIRVLDLADLASVRAFARALSADTDRLDLLVNNAGVMATPARASRDGFELQLATNHLGPFALTGLLLPLLLRGRTGDGPPRVVTVSSLMHRSGRLNRADLMLGTGYTPYRAYSRSKLANLLFMTELQRRADAAGVRLASLAAHPGYAATNLQAVGPAMTGNRWLALAMTVGNRLLAQSPEQGAWPSLRAATDPGARGGDFFGPGRYGGLRGRPVRVPLAVQATKADDAAWLWERSVELTRVAYPELSAG
jgi:NAD(P)-dependent dehydrogenase (short-subunit alcohol dehydrogenase family)